MLALFSACWVCASALSARCLDFDDIDIDVDFVDDGEDEPLRLWGDDEPPLLLLLLLLLVRLLLDSRLLRESLLGFGGLQFGDAA